MCSSTSKGKSFTKKTIKELDLSFIVFNSFILFSWNKLFENGIICKMISDIKCGNSLCFNYDKEYSTNCSRFGQVIECRVFQNINQSSGGK